MIEASKSLRKAQRAVDESRFDDARLDYARALVLSPYSVEAWRGMGYSLLQLGNLSASLDALERALRLDQSDLLSLLLMGRLALRLQQPAAAKSHFEAILARLPASESARSGLVDALVAQGNLDGARAQAELLLREAPASEVGALAAARVAFFERDDERALRHFSRLVELRPAHAGHRYNRALCLLRLGRYQQAWNDYEERFAAGAVFVPFPKSPRWDGAPVGHLLIVAEQGLGDTILFSRFIAQAATRAQRVTLCCPPSLRAVLARSLGVPCVAQAAADRSGQGWPEHDAHVALMSLPHRLGAGAGALQPRPPYLVPDPARCAAWQQAFGARNGPRIGVVHSASTAHSTEANPFMKRSCAPVDLGPLVALPGVATYNLNLGPAAEVARRELPQLRDLPLPLADFDDSAAAMQCLDAVVSVDTAAAHVAGSSGVPLYLLLPFSHDWRWARLDGAPPWYPQVQTFLQDHPGDWAEPVRRMTEVLAADLARAASPR